MTKDVNFALELGMRTDYLMEQQARTGVKFDIESAKKLYQYCCDRMLELEKEVEPNLPTCPLNKGDLKDVTPPARLKKQGKDGFEPSSYFLKFAQKMKDNWDIDIDVNDFSIKQEPVITEGPMKLKHQAHLKNWLMDKWGWRPTLWNFKKDPKTNKAIRDDKGKLIKTTPKFHEGGKLCPNLEILGEIADVVRPIVEWLSLRNRRSVIYNPEKGTGWLCHPRLQVDGRLPAGSGGVTYTHRQKHRIVANIPRPDSALGSQMRDLFTCGEGNVLVGYDASSLEAVIKGHYAYKYPGGKEYYNKITDPDFDEHQETADSWGLSKRQDAKAGNYGLQYNQQPPGLADTYGISLEEAKRRWGLYWENNKPYRLCLDRLEKHWENRGKSSIKCSTTGYTLNSRSAHSLGSLLIQHTGAIIMDLSGFLMDKWLGGLQEDAENGIHYKYKGYVVKRVLYYHDEYAFECKPEIAEEILQLGLDSIRKSGIILNLNVPLDADGSIGKTWKDIH